MQKRSYSKEICILQQAVNLFCLRGGFELPLSDIVKKHDRAACQDILINIACSRCILKNMEHKYFFQVTELLKQIYGRCEESKKFLEPNKFFFYLKELSFSESIIRPEITSELLLKKEKTLKNVCDKLLLFLDSLSEFLMSFLENGEYPISDEISGGEAPNKYIFSLFNELSEASTTADQLLSLVKVKESCKVEYAQLDEEDERT